METKFVWSSDYETGNPRIDAQHKQLLELANLLWTALVEGKSDAVVTRAIDALSAYAHHHFTEEEAFFEQIATPLLSEHREQHRRLAKDVRDMAIADLQGSRHLGVKLETWVESKLVPHMMEADQAALRQATRPAAPSEAAL
jgi:hemerythrin-like metal-binding protein